MTLKEANTSQTHNNKTCLNLYIVILYTNDKTINSKAFLNRKYLGERSGSFSNPLPYVLPQVIIGWIHTIKKIGFRLRGLVQNEKWKVLIEIPALSQMRIGKKDVLIKFSR